jgi:hypothetical protein
VATSRGPRHTPRARASRPAAARMRAPARRSARSRPARPARLETSPATTARPRRSRAVPERVRSAPARTASARAAQVAPSPTTMSGRSARAAAASPTPPVTRAAPAVAGHQRPTRAAATGPGDGGGARTARGPSGTAGPIHAATLRKAHRAWAWVTTRPSSPRRAMSPGSMAARRSSWAAGRCRSRSAPTARTSARGRSPPGPRRVVPSSSMSAPTASSTARAAPAASTATSVASRAAGVAPGRTRIVVPGRAPASTRPRARVRASSASADQRRPSGPDGRWPWVRRPLTRAAANVGAVSTAPILPVARPPVESADPDGIRRGGGGP